MAEYIEREAVLKHLDECKGTPPEICYTFPIFTALECFVKNLPAADVAEVKRGEWIMKETMIRSPFAKNAYCSECLEETARAYNFCPNCGAKMKG